MITLNTRPRKEITGNNVSNWVAAFNPITYIFKREDRGILGTEVAFGNVVRINVVGDLSASLNVGEGVYLSSGIYERGGIVTGVGLNFIDTNIPFVANSTSGYVNYKQDWRINIQVINNDTGAVVSENLDFEDSPGGDVVTNLSGFITQAINSKNGFNYDVEHSKDENLSLGFFINYRELWRESPNTVFTSDFSEPTFVAFAAKQVGDQYGQILGNEQTFPLQLFPERLDKTGYEDPDHLWTAAASDDTYVYTVGLGITQPYNITRIGLNDENIGLVNRLGPLNGHILYDITEDSSFLYCVGFSYDTLTQSVFKVNKSDLTEDSQVDVAANTGTLGVVAKSPGLVWSGGTVGVSIVNDSLAPIDSITNGVARVESITYDNVNDQIFVAWSNGDIIAYNPATRAVLNTSVNPDGASSTRALFFTNANGSFLLIDSGANLRIYDASSYIETETIPGALWGSGYAFAWFFKEFDNKLIAYIENSNLLPFDLVEIDTLNYLSITTKAGILPPAYSDNGATIWSDLSKSLYGFILNPGNPSEAWQYKFAIIGDLPKWLNDFEDVKMWRNYPFDLGMILSNELKGFDIKLTRTEKDADGNILVTTTENLIGGNKGFINRFNVDPTFDDTTQICFSLSSEGEIFEYKRLDYTNNEYK